MSDENKVSEIKQALEKIEGLIYLVDFQSDSSPNSTSSEYCQSYFLDLFNKTISTKSPSEIIKDIIENRLTIIQKPITIDSNNWKTTNDRTLGVQDGLDHFKEVSLLLPIKSRQELSYGRFLDVKYENEIFYTILRFLEFADSNDIEVNEFAYNKEKFHRFVIDPVWQSDFIKINPSFVSSEWSHFNPHAYKAQDLQKIFGAENKVSSNSKQVLFRLIMAILYYDGSLLSLTNTRDLFNSFGELVGYKDYNQFDEAYVEIRKKLNYKLSPGRPQLQSRI